MYTELVVPTVILPEYAVERVDTSVPEREDDKVMYVTALV
jgi:hypothetical protein